AMTKVVAKLKDEYEKIVKPEEDAAPITDTEQVQTTKNRKIRSDNGVIVDGEYGCAVKFAKCCNPLPGDAIIGFVTKGYGISIHKQDCPNVEAGRQNPEYNERWLEAHWDNDIASTNSKSLFEAMIQIFAENNMTLLADITAALADMKVSLLSINTKKRTEQDIIINLTVGCKNIEHFNSIVSRIRNIEHVRSIARGFT
ncbi:MAG: bifunctional (p)ppGpp synthetase/guanosine-3',5'-bis(diphosphate) 3'-pyrophosphohydrolase, partial [Clostridia bacterium]|nr:bifunctional (p)ppGpp synthetase/guanosine-3',5'-bis(diphosphate) 3'-pyrophosphohydrolase [Clostridia bacterium]